VRPAPSSRRGERGVGRRAGELDKVGASGAHEPLESLPTANDAAPAEARMRVPSWATRCRSIRSCFRSRARSWVTRSLKTSPWSLRKSLSGDRRPPPRRTASGRRRGARRAARSVAPSRRRHWWQRPSAPAGSWGRWPVHRRFRRGRGRSVALAQIELVDDGGDRTHRVIGGPLGVAVDPPAGDLAALRARLTRTSRSGCTGQLGPAEPPPGDLAALRARDPHVALRLHRATRPGRAAPR